MKKKIYIVEVGLTKFFSESKEEALKLWEILSEGNIKTLRYAGYDWADKEEERFPFPHKIKAELTMGSIDLYESEEQAERSKRNIEKLKKAKIIKPTKK